MVVILDDRKENDKIIYNDIMNLRVEGIMKEIIESCVKNSKLENGDKVYGDKSQFVRSALIYYLEHFVSQKYPEGINKVPIIKNR